MGRRQKSKLYQLEESVLSLKNIFLTRLRRRIGSIKHLPNLLGIGPARRKYINELNLFFVIDEENALVTFQGKNIIRIWHNQE
jgi:hypothetical protein